MFVAGSAYGWAGKSKIVVVSGVFPDDNKKSAHRPMEAVFTLDTDRLEEASGFTKEMLLKRIQKLEEEAAELRRLVEELE